MYTGDTYWRRQPRNGDTVGVSRNWAALLNWSFRMQMKNQEAFEERYRIVCNELKP